MLFTHSILRSNIPLLIQEDSRGKAFLRESNESDADEIGRGREVLIPMNRESQSGVAGSRFARRNGILLFFGLKSDRNC